MTQKEPIEEAMRLPPEASAVLEPELIESFEGVEPGDDVGAAWADEIRKRLVEVDSGEVTPVPWEEARRRIHAPARAA